MLFRHKHYPSARVFVNATQSCKFSDFLYETTDKSLVALLKKTPDVEVVKAPTTKTAKAS